MKKKIITLSAAFMLLAGSVSASSINGDYKGNPIVKLTSGGYTVEPPSIPPMIIDNNIMIPASVLRNLGAEVTWDEETYTANISFPIVNNNTPIQPQSKASMSGDIIESSIDGDFNGWEGDTIFKLMNGQIWQQSSYDYTYYYAFMPNVVIYKSGALYKMKVDGVDSDIYVKRIR